MLMEQKIRVCWNKKKPPRFYWRGQWYTVRAVLDRWKDTGEWWREETPKLFVRLLAEGTVWEIYRDLQSGEWFLYRRYD